MLDEPCGGPGERRFFTARPAGEDATVPSRFGYYAGWRLVRELRPEMAPTDLLTLDIPAAQRLVSRRLDDLLVLGDNQGTARLFHADAYGSRADPRRDLLGP